MTPAIHRLIGHVQRFASMRLVTVVLALVVVSCPFAVAGEPSSESSRPDGIAADAWAKILPQLDGAGLKSYPTTTETAKIFASTPGASASFGCSTSADGDTIVVGAYRFVSYSGAAFVFERNQGGADNWGEVKKLLASDNASYSYFGGSVSISGDTIVVGANGAGSGGQAYVFERNAGGADNWGEVTILAGSDQTSGASFGSSVSLSGDHLVVGAKSQSGSTGAAYLYRRNSGGAGAWGQVAKLTSGVAGTLQFGSAVAISGDTVLVGAQNGDSAYIFERNAGGSDSWGQVTALTGSDTVNNDDFGSWVGIDGNTAAIGAVWADNGGYARGAVYVFDRNFGGADNWGEVAILAADDAADSHQLGTQVSVDGDVIAAGATASDDPGVVYLFERNAGGADAWGQVAKLSASDGQELQFGVAVSGANVVLGASADSTMAFGAGAAYIFRRSGDTWAQAQRLNADDTEQNDWFGFSLDMDGDIAVVGAWNEATVRGAAYVFERNTGGEDEWGQVAKLTAADGSMYDRFGFQVAISGNHVVAGAPAHSGAAYMAGAAYVFRRNLGGADAWGQVVKLTAPDAANYDQYGWSVAIDGELAVIGANKGDGATTDSGSAYLYSRNQGGADAWGQVTELTASDGVGFDYFGEAVAVANDVVAIGAKGNDASMGAVYLYGRNSGGADAWGQAAKLTASDGVAADSLGFSVAMHGSMVLTGATGASAAYLFERNAGGADNWGQVTKMTPSDGEFGDDFGAAVSLYAEIAAVGAMDAGGGAAESGAVYLYQRNLGGADGWGQLLKLEADDGATDDFFGQSVAVSDHRLWCGASGDDDAGLSSGSAYRFELSELIPMADLSITVDDGTITAVPGESTSYTIEVLNDGPQDVVGATVEDTFPAELSCSWSCSATGAATCTPGPVSGNLSDLVDLPAGESATYNAVCTIEPSTTGVVANTATVAPPTGITDDDMANNSATDDDTMSPETDLSVTLSSSSSVVVAGDVVTYTIVVANPGPSTVVGAQVSDVFPVEIIGVDWICAGSGGGSCTASGSGDIDETVTLPVGASVTFTATATSDSGAASGSLVNTTTVTAPMSVTERDPGDNTATATSSIIAVADVEIFSDGFENGDMEAWQ